MRHEMFVMGYNILIMLKIENTAFFNCPPPHIPNKNVIWLRKLLIVSNQIFKSRCKYIPALLNSLKFFIYIFMDYISYLRTFVCWYTLYYDLV